MDGVLHRSAGKNESYHDPSTKDRGSYRVEASKKRRENVKLYLDLETPGDKVETLSGNKISQIDDVREQRRDERPETMLGDSDCNAVDQQGKNVRGLQPGEAALKERLYGDRLPMKKALVEKRLSQDEATDCEEEGHSAVAVTDDPKNDVSVLRRECLATTVEGLYENVNKQSGADSDETEAIDLGNPVSVRRDTAKFHCVPRRIGSLLR
jgi:hypothetical protein